jgi:hypothetical protein
MLYAVRELISAQIRSADLGETMGISRVIVSSVFAGVMVASFALAAAPAEAQISCDDPRIVDKLPKLPDGCQKERITASGNQRPSLGWAQRSGENAWKDQVITKYGERFITWDNAACAKQECVPGALAGFKRCTYSGFPCARRPIFEDVYELNTSEIQEMQRLLIKAGYLKGSADGKFGDKTAEALVRWQRGKKLEEDPTPTRANLDKLRKG